MTLDIAMLKVMYGEVKEVSIDNAKLNLVNIDAKQDSYVQFTYTSTAKELNDKKVYNMQTLVLLV